MKIVKILLNVKFRYLVEVFFHFEIISSYFIFSAHKTCEFMSREDEMEALKRHKIKSNSLNVIRSIFFIISNGVFLHE